MNTPQTAARQRPDMSDEERKSRLHRAYLFVLSLRHQGTDDHWSTAGGIASMSASDELKTEGAGTVENAAERSAT